MNKAFESICESLIGPFLFIAAFVCMLFTSRNVSSMLRISREATSENRAVQQTSSPVEYDDVYEDFEVIAQIISEPDYVIVIRNNLYTTIEYDFLKGGDVLRYEKSTMNDGEGVYSYYHGANAIDLNGDVTESKYVQTLKYNENDVLAKVIYTKEGLYE